MHHPINEIMTEKLNFLVYKVPDLLRSIDHDTKGKWGKMNVHQMIEHMIDSVREASGRIPRTILTVEDKLPAYRNFLLSDKEFRPETKNPLMPDEPLPVRNPDVETSIKELEKELKYFVEYYTNSPDAIATNAVFGQLNYEEWILLLHKHAKHHLKQFGAL